MVENVKKILYSTLFRGLFCFRGAKVPTVTCFEGRYEGVCRPEHKVKWCASGWKEAKSIRVRWRAG